MFDHQNEFVFATAELFDDGVSETLNVCRCKALDEKLCEFVADDEVRGVR